MRKIRGVLIYTLNKTSVLQFFTGRRLRPPGIRIEALVISDVTSSNSAAIIIAATFYARKQYASRVFAIVWASVRLSVRPSVTLVSCIKTVQARVTKSLLWAAPRSLVYRDKISCHWVQGFPSNEGVEEGYPH